MDGKKRALLTRRLRMQKKKSATRRGGNDHSQAQLKAVVRLMRKSPDSSRKAIMRQIKKTTGTKVSDKILREAEQIKIKQLVEEKRTRLRKLKEMTEKALQEDAKVGDAKQTNDDADDLADADSGVDSDGEPVDIVRTNPYTSVVRDADETNIFRQIEAMKPAETKHQTSSSATSSQPKGSNTSSNTNGANQSNAADWRGGPVYTPAELRTRRRKALKASRQKIRKRNKARAKRLDTLQGTLAKIPHKVFTGPDSSASTIIATYSDTVRFRGSHLISYELPKPPSLFSAPPAQTLPAGFTAVMCRLNTLQVVAGDDKGNLHIWMTDTADYVCNIKCHDTHITDIKEVSDTVILTASIDGMIKAWDFSGDDSDTDDKDIACSQVFKPDPAVVTTCGGDMRKFESAPVGSPTITLCPDKKHMLVVYAYGFDVFELGSGRHVMHIPSCNQTFLSAAISADSRHIYIGTLRGVIYVVDPKTWAISKFKETQHHCSVEFLKVLSSSHLLTKGCDSFCVWSPNDNDDNKAINTKNEQQQQQRLQKLLTKPVCQWKTCDTTNSDRGDTITSLDTTYDGQHVVCAAPGIIRVYDTSDGKSVCLVTAHKLNHPISIHCAPHDERIFVADVYAGVQMWC